MSDRELREADEVRRFLLQGIWLQRAVTPRAETVAPALGWLLDLAATGEPLPPVGFVADVGHLALGLDREASDGRDPLVLPGWPPGLPRMYEDHVLGRLYADATFARASDALARYQGRDRDRGLAFLIDQLRRRAGFGGVHINPAAIKAQLGRPPDTLLAEGWESFERDGPDPLLVALYDDLVSTVRNLGDVLGREDVFELEHGTALAPFGERVALRQVLQAAAEFEARRVRTWPRPPSRRHDVPTRVLDEDVYPVGGFSSISTRGSVESLLHSQLAFMEKEGRPDLFDIKFLRDELLYYARDENQFLRQRRTYVFALFPDLVRARCKDAALPRQRIILLLALLVAAVRTLTEWLSGDALTFEFVFVEHSGGGPLLPERALMEMVLREAIANGTVATTAMPMGRLAAHCRARADRSLCHALAIGSTDHRLEAEWVQAARLVLDGPRPRVASGDEALVVPEADDPPESWHTALDWLLPRWV